MTLKREIKTDLDQSGFIDNDCNQRQNKRCLRLGLKSYFSYSMRNNHFLFQVMTDFDRDEIVFSSKDILTLIISIKTVIWGINLI